MDFRAGPPSQVLQSVTVSGQPDARQLAAAGLDATSLLNGAAQVQAVLSERRNGQGDVAVTADLTGGGAGRGTARMAQAARRPGEGIGARAAGPRPADRHRGRPARRRWRRPARARGIQRRQAVGVPHRPAGAGAHRRAGHGRTCRRRARSLSISAVRRSIWRRVSAVALRRSRRTRDRTEPPPGPSWVVDAKFDRVLMAQGRASSDVMAARRE